MAETAGLVLMDGEMFIKEEQLSQHANLSLAIERVVFYLAERVCLNPVNFGLDSRHLPIKRGRHPATKVSW